MHLSFTTPVPRDEDITFDIDGERFECITDMNAQTYITLTAIAPGNNAAVLDFIYASVVEDERERLQKTIVERVVPAQVVADIYTALREVYGGKRPTKPSAGS